MFVKRKEKKQKHVGLAWKLMHTIGRIFGWRPVVEFHKPWMDLRIEVADGYVMVYADDGDDWKEFAIYTLNPRVNVEEVARHIERALQEGDMYEVANLVGELVDEFVIGECGPALDCPRLLASAETDENLNWDLCYTPASYKHIKRLMEEGLIPEEWMPHVERLLS